MPKRDKETVSRWKHLVATENKLVCEVVVMHLSEKNPPAVIIGLDSMQGIQTARILAGHGIKVIAIADDPKHHCCKTNTCDEILFSNSQNDEFLEVLNEIAVRWKNRPVLFPCHDETVRVISRHRKTLQKNFRFSLADPDTIEMLSHKVSFYDYAQANDLPVALTFVIRSQSDADAAAREMHFPAVLKPSARTRLWDQNTMSKAYRLSSADEFLALYKRCRSWTDTLVLQEWIDGGDDCLYSCNCYFDGNSQPLCTFVARKLRQWPPYTGISSLGEEVRNDVVLEESLRLFRGVNYRGLGYVEFKKSIRNGKHYIVEPNIGRPTGRSAIAEAGGVQMLYTMYCDVVGLPLPERRVQMYRGAKWIDIRHDFQSAFYYWRNGDISLYDWYKSWRGPKAHTYFSWRDPAPFLFDLLALPRRIFSQAERKKRDYLSTRKRSKQRS